MHADAAAGGDEGVAVQQLSDKPQAFVHYRTLLPRHPHLPRKRNGVTHVSGTICHLCLGPLTTAEPGSDRIGGGPLDTRPVPVVGS